MFRTTSFPVLRTASRPSVTLLAVSPLPRPPLRSPPLHRAPSLPDFQGSAVKPHPITPTRAPQNPFIARQPVQQHPQRHLDDRRLPASPGRSGSNLVATLRREGGLRCAARSPSTPAGGSSPSAPRPARRPQARIIDPDNLATIDSFDLPQAPDPPGTQTYQNFTGGGYFFLDNKDRIWVPTKTDHIFVIGESADGQTLAQAARLRPHRRPRRGHRADHLGAARLLRPDLVRLEEERQGRDARPQDRQGQGEDGSARRSRTPSRSTGSGVYIVSDKRMYRFEVGAERQAA